MSAHVLITGSLFRDPEQRMSKAGKPFVSATMKVKDGDAISWWKLLCFSEAAQAELSRLGDGEAVSAQGRLTAEIYTKKGESRLALGVIADCVLARRQPPKPRQSPRPKQQQNDKPRRPREASGDLLDHHCGEGYVHPGLDDEMPF
jgi:single-stranded DNA-binding protein